jgi:hypothetical protein
MEIDFGVLADAATVDSSGKLNVLGIFDRIQAAQFPARHGRVSLVLRFSAGLGEAGAHQVEIRLRGPNNKEIVRLDGRMDLGPGARAATEGMKVPHVLNLDGITFPEAGTYSFDISSDGEHLLSIPLHLETASGTPAASPRTAVAGFPSPFVQGRGGSAEA